MPPIKNWTKVDGTTYEYELDTSLQLRIWNSNQTTDGRHSLWFGDLFYEDEQVKEIVHGETTKRKARKAATSWMRDTPLVEFELLSEA